MPENTTNLPQNALRLTLPSNFFTACTTVSKFPFFKATVNAAKEYEEAMVRATKEIPPQLLECYENISVNGWNLNELEQSFNKFTKSMNKQKKRNWKEAAKPLVIEMKLDISEAEEQIEKLTELNIKMSNKAKWLIYEEGYQAGFAAAMKIRNEN